MLYTAQMRYSGADRLDVTVKSAGKVGKIFAPTWEMVNMVKRATSATKQRVEHRYTDEYYRLLLERFKTNQMAFEHVITTASVHDITLVCYCPAGAFCHRHLLAGFFNYNWGTPLGGERQL